MHFRVSVFVAVFTYDMRFVLFDPFDGSYCDVATSFVLVDVVCGLVCMYSLFIPILCCKNKSAQTECMVSYDLLAIPLP